jgi:hypothetical protein
VGVRQVRISEGDRARAERISRADRHVFGHRASGDFTFQFRPTNKGFGIGVPNHDRLLVRLIDIKPVIESPVAQGARLDFAIFNGAIAPLGRGQR